MDALEEKPVQQQPAGDDQDQTTPYQGEMIRILPGILLRVAMGQVKYIAPGVNEKPSSCRFCKNRR